MFFCITCAFFAGCGTKADDNRILNSTDPLAVLLDCPASQFNIQLAKIAAELSEVSEKSSDSDIRKVYDTYGIGRITTYNYNTNILGGGAFVIGTTSIKGKDEDFTLLVITARGSTTTAELVGDQRWLEEITFWRKKDFLEYKVWDNVLDFEEKMWDGLVSYINANSSLKSEENLKLLITGHSLGGASANLLAARITNGISKNEWWSKTMTKEDIYAYTFNGITVLTTPDNVENGYENIHNVYNYYDSFGPNGSQSHWNASSPYAKFGHTELYYKQEEESDGSVHAHGNYRYALEHPEECSLSTCTGIINYEHSSTIEENEQIIVEEDNSDEMVEFNSEGNQEDYYDGSEFELEGDWVSVGENGFGQAQPGEVVSFDGKHCNFFSPYDEYVFYQNEEGCFLECTSLGFKETITFPVEIIDSDYIAIYYGDLVTELMWADYFYDDEGVYEDVINKDISAYGIVNGTYLSTDGFFQEFTFYGENGVILSAFGISAEGTYEISNGKIIVNYEFLGSQVWSPTFSMSGDSIYIAGTEFVLE